MGRSRYRSRQWVAGCSVGLGTSFLSLQFHFQASACSFIFPHGQPWSWDPSSPSQQLWPRNLPAYIVPLSAISYGPIRIRTAQQSINQKSSGRCSPGQQFIIGRHQVNLDPITKGVYKHHFVKSSKTKKMDLSKLVNQHQQIFSMHLQAFLQRIMELKGILQTM